MVVYIVISAHRRLRQEILHKFKASIGYIGNFQASPGQKEKKNLIKNYCNKFKIYGKDITYPSGC